MKMSEKEPRFPATFEDARQRQLLLGLRLSVRERLTWLETRRSEVARLRALMPDRNKER